MPTPTPTPATRMRENLGSDSFRSQESQHARSLALIAEGLFRRRRALSPPIGFNTRARRRQRSRRNWGETRFMLDFHSCAGAGRRQRSRRKWGETRFMHDFRSCAGADDRGSRRKWGKTRFRQFTGLLDQNSENMTIKTE